ncbi:hypothetical protein LJY25_07380 [Hymenobacter sp. BT175]|uniref:hypothetical protein n=1 Tax=Hymenobacter translucens TaxID=2886507 RepID=UPI001D0EE855|nr:hypothetical protein [Hymenobacter translucens]MCC2546262.1 hypothetical protein [Hymenobacter translucens]
MMKPPFLPPLLNAAKATGLYAWQTGILFRKIARNALDTVQEVLRAEIKKGNVQLVADFLAGKALPAARSLLLKRMTAMLLVRIGLRGALASNVVGWILPFVLERLIRVGVQSGFFDKVKANSTVAEALQRLDELKRATWKVISPDAGSGAEVLPDEEEPQAQLPSGTTKKPQP